MSLKFLSATDAAALDKELMSTGAFSIDQLMELAGLSCASAVYKTFPPSTHPRVLIVVGPGNNGGDGLVAARHLSHFGYEPAVLYPKVSKKELYARLVKQLEDLKVPFLDPQISPVKLKSYIENSTDQVMDGIFGFSFHPPIRAPFDEIISIFESSTKPITAIDIPSSWDVNQGPPPNGQVGSSYLPQVLVSLTAPKPSAAKFVHAKPSSNSIHKHFLGGRFVAPAVAQKWHFDIPKYPGVEQVVDISDEK